MEITGSIKSAIWAYLVNEESSTHALGEQIGVSHTTVGRWTHGDTKTIRNAIWMRLHPIIQPYLEEEEPERWLTEKPAVYQTNKARKGTPLTQVNKAKLKRVPVIGIAQAASYCPAVESWSTFLDEHGDTDMWDEVEDGCLLLRVEGTSGLPLLSPGALLYTDTRIFPKRGELVVALMTDNELPVVKYYDRIDNVVHLLSINDDEDCKNFTIDLKDPGADRIVWMHPVTDIRTKPPTKRLAP